MRLAASGSDVTQNSALPPSLELNDAEAHLQMTLPFTLASTTTNQGGRDANREVDSGRPEQKKKVEKLTQKN